jgi:hypothetical protein
MLFNKSKLASRLKVKPLSLLGVWFVNHGSPKSLSSHERLHLVLSFQEPERKSADPILFLVSLLQTVAIHRIFFSSTRN